MNPDLSPADRAKLAAAIRAVQEVRDGMRVGLGTGSTAAWMVRYLAHVIRTEKLNIVGVPTSTSTAKLARALGITLSTLDQTGTLDITIDGADEFDRAFQLIKGGGGALLQEKIVAAASTRMIVIADKGKAVAKLGAFPLPVEVIAFGGQSSLKNINALLQDLGYQMGSLSWRMAGDSPFVTDEGNYIVDLPLNNISDAKVLASALNQIPGVVENGLFIDLCDTVVLGGSDGAVEVLTQGAHAPVQSSVDLGGIAKMVAPTAQHNAEEFQ